MRIAGHHVEMKVSRHVRHLVDDSSSRRVECTGGDDGAQVMLVLLQ